METSYMGRINAAALRSKLTITLDENLFMLKRALIDTGFKVLMIRAGMSDEDIQEIADGTAILTKNSRHFRNEAVRNDYDVIAVEEIKFIDTKENRTNETVVKIANAVRQSGFYNMRGNFELKIHDDGSWDLTPLV